MAGLDALPVIESSVDLRNAEFAANRSLWEPILERFEEQSRLASAEATASTQLRHQSRGQLLGKSAYHRTIPMVTRLFSFQMLIQFPIKLVTEST